MGIAGQALKAIRWIMVRGKRIPIFAKAGAKFAGKAAKNAAAGAIIAKTPYAPYAALDAAKGGKLEEIIKPALGWTAAGTLYDKIGQELDPNYMGNVGRNLVREQYKQKLGSINPKEAKLVRYVKGGQEAPEEFLSENIFLTDDEPDSLIKKYIDIYIGDAVSDEEKKELIGIIRHMVTDYDDMAGSLPADDIVGDLDFENEEREFDEGDSDSISLMAGYGQIPSALSTYKKKKNPADTVPKGKVWHNYIGPPKPQKPTSPVTNYKYSESDEMILLTDDKGKVIWITMHGRKIPIRTKVAEFEKRRFDKKVQKYVNKEKRKERISRFKQSVVSVVKDPEVRNTVLGIAGLVVASIVLHKVARRIPNSLKKEQIDKIQGVMKKLKKSNVAIVNAKIAAQARKNAPTGENIVEKVVSAVKKRGRPAKAKAVVEEIVSVKPAEEIKETIQDVVKEIKKRGRPAKVKPLPPVEEAKAIMPEEAKTVTEAVKKKRGRPPKEQSIPVAPVEKSGAEELRKNYQKSKLQIGIKRTREAKKVAPAKEVAKVQEAVAKEAPKKTVLPSKKPGGLAAQKAREAEAKVTEEAQKAIAKEESARKAVLVPKKVAEVKPELPKEKVNYKAGDIVKKVAKAEEELDPISKARKEAKKALAFHKDNIEEADYNMLLKKADDLADEKELLKIAPQVEMKKMEVDEFLRIPSMDRQKIVRTNAEKEAMVMVNLEKNPKYQELKKKIGSGEIKIKDENIKLIPPDVQAAKDKTEAILGRPIDIEKKGRGRPPGESKKTIEERTVRKADIDEKVTKMKKTNEDIYANMTDDELEKLYKKVDAEAGFLEDTWQNDHFMKAKKRRINEHMVKYKIGRDAATKVVEEDAGRTLDFMQRNKASKKIYDKATVKQEQALILKKMLDERKALKKGTGVKDKAIKELDDLVYISKKHPEIKSAIQKAASDTEIDDIIKAARKDDAEAYERVFGKPAEKVASPVESKKIQEAVKFVKKKEPSKMYSAGDSSVEIVGDEVRFIHKGDVLETIQKGDKANWKVGEWLASNDAERKKALTALGQYKNEPSTSPLGKVLEKKTELDKEEAARNAVRRMNRAMDAEIMESKKKSSLLNIKMRGQKTRAHEEISPLFNKPMKDLTEAEWSADLAYRNGNTKEVALELLNKGKKKEVIKKSKVSSAPKADKPVKEYDTNEAVKNRSHSAIYEDLKKIPADFRGNFEKSVDKIMRSADHDMIKSNKLDELGKKVKEMAGMVELQDDLNKEYVLLHKKVLDHHDKLQAENPLRKNFELKQVGFNKEQAEKVSKEILERSRYQSGQTNDPYSVWFPNPITFEVPGTTGKYTMKDKIGAAMLYKKLTGKSLFPDEVGALLRKEYKYDFSEFDEEKIKLT